MVIIIQIMYLSIISSSRFIRTILKYFLYSIQLLIILPLKIIIYTFLNLILHTEYDVNSRKFPCFLAFIFKTLNPVESFSLLPLLYRTIQPVSSAEYSYLSVLSYTQHYKPVYKWNINAFIENISYKYIIRMQIDGFHLYLCR